MLEKGFAATTSTDAHGDKLSKKQLIQMANEINEDKYARGAGLAHDLARKLKITENEKYTL